MSNPIGLRATMVHSGARGKSGALDAPETMSNYPALFSLEAGAFFTCAASQDC
jgi:hypothetical protein